MNGEKSLGFGLPSFTNFIFYWLPPAVCAILILYFSSLDPVYAPPFTSADKVFHLGEYALLAYLLARALMQHRPKEKRQVFTAAVFSCVIFGIGIELYQSLLPARHPSVMDALANGIGSLLGAGIYTKRRKV